MTQQQYFIDQQTGLLCSFPAEDVREDGNIQPVEIGCVEAEKHAKGVFQRRLLEGEARWSMSDIKGAARRSKPHYMRSRGSLVRRLEAAGHTCEIVKVFTLTRRWQLVLLVDGCAVSRLD
jgi:hypothetical protein